MATLYPPLDVIERRRPELTQGEKYLLDFLIMNYDDEYEVFCQPYLNGDLPDIILMRKGGGVLVIEVKDWNISNYQVNEVGKWIVKANNAVNTKNPLSQVLNYKRNLYDLHIDSLLELHLKDYKYWHVVHCAVYFHMHNEKEAKVHCYGNNPSNKYKTFLEKNFSVLDDVCPSCKRKYIYSAWKNKRCPNCGSNQKEMSLILGKDSLMKDNFDSIFDATKISKKYSYFTNELYLSFSRLLRPSIHTLSSITDFELSPTQKELARSEENARKRIKGVAGSGKTLVLAQRAVNAHKRTGEKVLILTYNLTLKNYIHDKISAVRENFSWEYFHINNYHEFIKANMNNVGIEIEASVNESSLENHLSEIDENFYDKQVYSNLSLFDGYHDKLPKYNSILIDETQDYQENWIRLIVNNFATDKAEIIAFADEKQNIYSRDLDSSKMPIIPIQVGAWDKKLNKSYRLSKKVALLATEFQKKFFSDKYIIEVNIETNPMLSLFEPHIEYHYCSGNKLDEIVEYIYHQIISNSFNSNDITILASRIMLLRELNSLLRSKSKEKTNIMFETEEEYNKLFPDSPNGNAKNFQIDKVRKNRKANFRMNRGTIKLSTIHSFKGWESPVIFLIIEQNTKDSNYLLNTEFNTQGNSTRFRPEQFSDELVYVGFTRCQNNLFIINFGNKNYHDFFNNCAHIDYNIPPKLYRMLSKEKKLIFAL